MFNKYLDISNNFQNCRKILDITNKNIIHSNSKSYNKRRILSNHEYDIYRITSEQINRNIKNSENIFQFSNIQLNIIKEIKSFINFQGNIDEKINSLINTIGEIKKDPTDINYRNYAFQSIKDVVFYFKEINNNLTKCKLNILDEINENIKTVNEIIQNILSINEKIKLNNNIFDLYDDRDYLLHNLSKYLSCNVNVDNDGITSIFLNDGSIILDKDICGYLNLEDINQNYITLKYDNQKKQILNLEEIFNNGKLGGIISFYRENFNEIQNKLNKMVLLFVEKFNTINTSGYDLLNNPGKKIFNYKMPDIINHPSNKGNAQIKISKIGNINNFLEDLVFKYDGKSWVCENENIKIFEDVKFIKLDKTEVKVVSGVPLLNDKFILKNSKNIINSISLNIENGMEIASSIIDDNISNDNSVNCMNIQKFLDFRDNHPINSYSIYDIISEFYYYINNTDKNLQNITKISKENLYNLSIEKDKVSGINFDEEYIQMEMCLKYYKINSKMLQVVDSILESLLNIIK